MYEAYRGFMKDKFNESMAKELKAQALRELIYNRLLTQEADRLGLKVSDKELQAAIMRDTAFSNDGRFDQKRYERVLDSINMKPAVFEANERGILLNQKLEQLVRDSVGVTDAELAAAYKQRNPKAKPGDFEKVKESFRQTYLAGKQREALAAYVRRIYEKTPIKVDDTLLAS